jgi:hypothetical protein
MFPEGNGEMVPITGLNLIKIFGAIFEEIAVLCLGAPVNCPELDIDLLRVSNYRGVKLTTHLQLVPRSRKCGSIHPLPHTSSWRNG